MHLYLIRHGQSYLNLPEYPASNADEPLTPLGQRQADALAQWLPTTLPTVDAIYASTLRRTVETAQPLAAAYRVALQLDHRLREIGCNRHDHRPWPDQALPQYADFWSSERPFASITPAVDAGESLMHFRTRVGAFVEDLLPYHQQQHVLLVTHSRVIELIFDHLFNIGPWRRCEIAVQHSALTHFEQITVPGREHWRLHYHNRIDHLAQLATKEIACFSPV